VEEAKKRLDSAASSQASLGGGSGKGKGEKCKGSRCGINCPEGNDCFRVERLEQYFANFPESSKGAKVETVRRKARNCKQNHLRKRERGAIQAKATFVIRRGRIKNVR